MVLFPSNATHLIQTLDIAVFKTIKFSVKKFVSEFMLENAITTITKKYSMDVGSKSCIEGIQYKTKKCFCI